MNLQRIAAIVAISGAVVGGASVVALGVAAYAANQPEPVPTAAAEPTTADVEPTPTEQSPAPATVAPTEVAPATPERVPGTGVMAADYNPYLEPGDPEYLSIEERAEYLGQDAVVRQCMNDAGFEYLPNLWWIGEGPQPPGLDFETSVLWTQALYGPDIYNPGGGCADAGAAAAEAARAAGTPLTAPVPPDDPVEADAARGVARIRRRGPSVHARRRLRGALLRVVEPRASAVRPAGRRTDARGPERR